MRVRIGLVVLALSFANAASAGPVYTLEQALAIAHRQNPDILIARKNIEAARGGYVEARAGYLPSVVSTGIARKRERQAASRFRDDDYEASLRVVQNLYTGGQVSGQNAIARLNIEKQQHEYAAVVDRITLEVRLAFYELLLNRANINLRETALGVFQQEVQTQQERLSAGTVGELNVRRAEVMLANELPELLNAKTQVRNFALRLGELLGEPGAFEISGALQDDGAHPPAMDQCLAQAVTMRPEVKARENDVRIQREQIRVDRSELRPRVELFTGYEFYNERDRSLPSEVNHGYIVGLNGSWKVFDGFATRGRIQATQARLEAAQQALASAKLSAEADVRRAFLDLQQAERVLATEKSNGQNADRALQISRQNVEAGVGTQLDVLQAAGDVTRTGTTRLNAIYLHQTAQARLARACGWRSIDPENGK